MGEICNCEYRHDGAWISYSVSSENNFVRYCVDKRVEAAVRFGYWSHLIMFALDCRNIWTTVLAWVFQKIAS